MRERLRQVWAGVTRVEAGEASQRKTALLPSVLSPYGGMMRPGGEVLPKPTPANLRKFAETPAPRRAINTIKDRIASMDWQVRLKRGFNAAQVENAAGKMAALRAGMEEPNGSDSFRTLCEQVLEDLLVGGFGSVRSPVTRSSADCENAAAAVLSFSIDRAAAIAGRYTAANLQQSSDVWPGDLLTLTTGNGAGSIAAVVRSVSIEDGHCAPELLNYTIAFANDWAESLSMKLSSTVAADALLPQSASSAPGQALANLQLTLTGYSATALQVDAGMTPVTGGGLEVRRRDGDFGPGVDQDLVLRSTVRSFTIPRAAQSEEYFVRAYDASTPPLYSRFSSVIATDLPTS